MEETTQSTETVTKPVDITEKRFNIQLKKGEKVYIFSVPDATPYGEAYDACLEVLVALNGMINAATEKLAPNVAQPIVDSSVTAITNNETNQDTN